MVQDSVETWRLYSAEASVPLADARFLDLASARRYLADVQSSTWWRWNIREAISIVMDDSGRDVGHEVSSYSMPLDDPPTSWTISMHPQQLDAYHLLHEVAHCIAPRWRFGGATEDPSLPAHSALSFHGPHFSSVRLRLTEEFGSPAEAARLLDAFDHFDVPTMEWADVLAGMEETRLAEADLDQMKQRSPDAFLLLQGLLRVGRSISPADLGRTLLAARLRSNLSPGAARMTQSELATQISAVIPCTPRLISRVEHLQVPPPTKRIYQIALCMAVVLHLDPIQAQYQLGLNREDDWDIPLDQLVILNPGWVSLIEDLNGLIGERPPRWYV